MIQAYGWASGCSCAEDWDKMMERLPPLLDDPYAMPRRTWEWHEAVNRRKRKAKFPWAAAKRQYEWPLSLDPGKAPRKIILKQFLSLGDIVCMTAIVRRLHDTYPGMFTTAVHTSCYEVWNENPLVWTGKTDGYNEIEIEQPLINYSNQGSWHVIDAQTFDLSEKLGIDLPAGKNVPEIFLSQEEVNRRFDFKYWVVVPGWKSDAPIKAPNIAAIQGVISALSDQPFVQVGFEGKRGPDEEFSPPLAGKNVLNAVGQTCLRSLFALIKNSEGVICGNTGCLHVAAAFGKPCIVLAGGREPDTWSAYPNQMRLSAIGKLDCCKSGGCWKSHLKDCVHIQGIRPKCQDDISAEQIIAAMRSFR